MMRISPSIRKLLEGITDGACVSDARGRLLYMNPAAEALLGVTGAAQKSKPLCGLLCSKLCDPDQRRAAARCPLRGRGRGGTAFTLEARFEPAKPGAKRAGPTLSVRCLRLPRERAADQAGARLTLLTDVSSRASEEKRREDWRAMVVHDLRAPLTNIYAVLRELELDASEGRAQVPGDETLDIAVRNCRRMMGMLELYLAVARFDACMMPVRKAALDLGEFLRECVREQSSFAEERGIEVIVDAPAGLLAQGDPQLLSRALQNLLNNAIKFSVKHGTVRVWAGRDSGGRAAVSFQDSGPGIAAHDIARIFDRYAQAGGLRRRDGAGTGLGLTFCRQAVTAMKGELTVESRPGEGSLFTVFLPPAPSRQRAAVAPARRGRFTGINPAAIVA